MELIDLIPEFNLYEDFWKIYTKSDIIAPQYISNESKIEKAIIGEGTEVYGEVVRSVIGSDVRIGKGSVVRDSIIMKDVVIGDNVTIDKGIIAEGTVIGDNVVMGIGEEAPNRLNASIYNDGLVTVGEHSVIPSGVQIGKNTAIAGQTLDSDYPDGILASGEYIVKAGDQI
jgi:glucose-1-phosphate adenylyltransferase